VRVLTKTKRIWMLMWLVPILAIAFGSFPGPQIAFSETGVVRLALVVVPDEVVRPLLPEFQKQTGMRAEIVYSGNDPYAIARAGKADLVISHYGHEGVKPFVTEGLGLWPHPVFANQMVLLGPPNDPAHVRRLSDVSEAFRRIAASKSNFLSNNGSGAKYLEEILWRSASVTEKGSWYLDSKSEGSQAVREAARKGAYVLWGLPPYLRLKRQGPLALEPLVVQDPIFQRIMVAIVVNPKKVQGVNAEGATALQEFLISPAIQARIRAFRYADFDQQVWWPAGRHNAAHE
jgi:tungstate transport system substrate-binding protein